MGCAHGLGDDVVASRCFALKWIIESSPSGLGVAADRSIRTPTSKVDVNIGAAAAVGPRAERRWIASGSRRANGKPSGDCCARSGPGC